MSNTKEIKDRIKSVKDTQKIANAMYLISSTKMRRAKAELDGTRPYFSALRREIGRIFGYFDNIESKYFYPKDYKGPTDKPDACLVITADKGLSGGVSLPATTWTMGGMCAQTAGLPLKIPVYNTYMDTQGSFFNSVTALGDILAENGYPNEIMMGSDSVFGGRRMYFTEHGDYRIFDFFTAYSSGMIHNKVFWGFEDHMLFEFSRKELKKLYEEGKPFNYTMLTVDTHFEDGHKCALCSDDFEDRGDR